MLNSKIKILIVIFNRIDENEFLILNRITIDLCIFIDSLSIHSQSYNIYIDIPA